jgi:murein DD-endopeptidase MepM/ murein hydrolase activator NlpD
MPSSYQLKLLLAIFLGLFIKIIYYKDMKNFRFTFLALILVVIVVVIFKFLPAKQSSDANPTDLKITDTPLPVVKIIIEPLDNSADRITKKHYGTFVTPQNSPVQPEKFSGFHTGTDFEIFSGEENLDVPFYALCDGKLLQKRTASGYGSVMVQSCTINNEAVTVVYGHIRLGSINKKTGDEIKQGEQLGVLGTSPSETDGERKHLHLGIHKGTSINILGYVQKESELSSWLDYEKLK